MSTQHASAYQAGRYARQAGRGLESCPRYGITPESRDEARAWQQGWHDEDREQVAARTSKANAR